MKVSPGQLSPCQKKALQILKAGWDNVFITGRAGSGKSYLLRHFLKNKDRKYFPIVASTGAAAVLVGGRTFHSFFGLGVMEGGVEKTIARALDSSRVVNRLKKIEGFVLDEVSMISGPTFRAAEEICRRARNHSLPWGGARVIAVGDFSQLPPVNPWNQKKEWAFLEEAWKRSQFISVLLESMMRTQDEEYLEVLNFIRDGIVNDRVREYLDRRTDPDLFNLQAPKDVPHLFPRREMADSFNRMRLAEIQKPLHEFRTLYTGNPMAIEKMKQQAPIPEILSVKEGALVMIRVNDPQYQYVNGSLGTIVMIEKDEMTLRLSKGREVTIHPESFSLLDADGKAMATATNFPLLLAYATTIHKAQGATLDAMVCDLQKLWEPGHAYVALSRLRKGAGLTLTGWDEASIRVDPHVVEFYRQLEKEREGQ